ncbi:putative feruloyl esterase [Microsporum ferrugineum]
MSCLILSSKQRTACEAFLAKGGPTSPPRGGATSEGIEFKEENNALAALVDWVEKGVAPDTLEGVKFEDDEITSGVSLRRRHCRYPRRNVQTRTAETIAASSGPAMIPSMPESQMVF